MYTTILPRLRFCFNPSTLNQVASVAVQNSWCTAVVADTAAQLAFAHTNHATTHQELTSLKKATAAAADAAAIAAAAAATEIRELKGYGHAAAIAAAAAAKEIRELKEYGHAAAIVAAAAAKEIRELKEYGRHACPL